MPLRRIYSHVVFTLKNSRYDLQRIQRKKPFGYIAPNYPFMEGKDEEILIEVLCNIAYEIDLDIIALNFCGDHVHCILRSDKTDLSKIIMLWKGKTSYVFNRLENRSIENKCAIKSDEKKYGLWAKSYYQKIIKTEEELNNAINYINLNRMKHGLQALSDISIERINKILRK